MASRFPQDVSRAVPSSIDLPLRKGRTRTPPSVCDSRRDSRRNGMTWHETRTKIAVVTVVAIPVKFATRISSCFAPRILLHLCRA